MVEPNLKKSVINYYLKSAYYIYVKGFSKTLKTYSGDQDRSVSVLINFIVQGLGFTLMVNFIW